MGLFKKLKKAVKGVRKALHLPAITVGNVAKVAGATALGGPLGGAAAVLKSKLKSAAIGGVKQVLKSKAEKAVVAKIQKLAPALGPVASKAIARPGGAPLAGAAAGAAAKLRRATHSRRKRKKAPGTKRRAPTGGLDLKALSASWKAAGKPGTWLAWVKSRGK